jgi:hypothetical protein
MNMKKIPVVYAALAILGTFQLFADPFISSFSPTYASSDDVNPILINGSGFSPGTLIVKFNGVQDATAYPNAAGTLINAHVPAGAPLGSGPIFISVNGVANYSGDDFTVIGPGPYIDNFSPTIGSGATPVTINGAHFTSDLTVKFNGLNAPGPIPTSFTSFTRNAPTGVTTGPITVSNAQGSHTSAGFFYAQPGISGFSPAAGRAGTNVIITGTNFLGATAVRFGSLNAATFNVLSNGAVQATVPIGATNGTIRVIAPAGSAFSSSNFVVQPTVSGFTPVFGPVGTSVIITGANFTNGTPVVRFNGVQAANPTGVSFGQLTAVVPNGATTGLISVTTTNGSSTNDAKFYLPAAITSVTPIFGPAGTPVTVAGTNFTDATAFTFNGTPAAAFSVQNNNSIGAIVPFGIASGPITVTTPAGTATNNAVKFYGAPLIGSFLPSHGLPGTNVTLTGQNFLDATAVLFNGTNAAYSVVNNTTINAIVPTNALTGPITVMTPGGTNTTPVNFVLDYSANLSVVVSDSPDPVLVGSNITYSIIISNAGPFAAPGVTLTDTLIGPGMLKAATTSQGTLNTNGSPITGDLGQINVSSIATVTLTVAAQDVGTITNIATVASLYADPAPGNNSVTNITYVQPLPILSVRRSDATGVRISWNAALTNYGLEFNSNVVSAAIWSNVISGPVIVGSEYQLTETNNQPMRYYRLHRLP